MHDRPARPPSGGSEAHGVAVEHGTEDAAHGTFFGPHFYAARLRLPWIAAVVARVVSEEFVEVGPRGDLFEPARLIDQPVPRDTAFLSLGHQPRVDARYVLRGREQANRDE